MEAKIKVKLVLTTISNPFLRETLGFQMLYPRLKECHVHASQCDTDVKMDCKVNHFTEMEQLLGQTKTNKEDPA